MKPSQSDFEQALEVCATEPIHLIGQIQPHGALLVMGNEHQILQVSENIGEFVCFPAASVFGMSIAELLGTNAASEIRHLIQIAREQGTSHGRLLASRHEMLRDLLAHLYISDGLYVLELEIDEGTHQEARLADLLLETQQSMLRSESDSESGRYFELVARFVRDLTGYDSAMVYRFDDDWNGEIIAQSRAEHAPSYLGMHFPASDIPVQARRLYTTNLVRVVANVDATPVPIVPPLNPVTGQQLDMTYSAIRSMSPIHIEYLRNIGVHASMVISLLQNGRLWGLIACHHLSKKHVSMAMRDAAIFISRLVSGRLSAMEALEKSRLTDKAQKINGDLLKSMSREPIASILGRLLPDLKDLLNATGVFAIVEGERYFHGDVPDSASIDKLVDWLGNKTEHEVFFTDTLAEDQESPFASCTDEIAGVLSTPPSREMRNCIVWLRREKPQTVKWAGRYEEGFVQNASGNYRLTPRKSFEIWTESWIGRSEPWSPVEIGVAIMLALSLPEALSQKWRLELALKERKKIEDELRQHRDHLEDLVQERTIALSIAKEAAEAASRAKSTFLSNMRHELRTPMHAVIGMTDIALRRTDDPKLKDLLGKADKASHHLLDVINDILDISKIEAERLTLEKKRFVLGDILRHLTLLVDQKLKEKGLVLEIDTPPTLIDLALWGDSLRLEQILINLTSNAIKFTDSGTIRLRVLLIEETPDSTHLRFEVEDEGIGISAENQKRLFTAFEQADSSMTRMYGGTGLGLAISKRLAQFMGGDIGVSSQLGAGSTFWVTARFEKLADARAPANELSSNPTEVHPNTRFNSVRILLAEDEPVNQEVSRLLLENTGLLVDIAEDGAEAVRLAKERYYPLVLMDLQMPKMNGIEAAHMIRALPGYEHVPILAMTANAFEADRQACKEAGMNDHIPKPVDPAKLLHILSKWLTDPAS